MLQMTRRVTGTRISGLDDKTQNTKSSAASRQTDGIRQRLRTEIAGVVHRKQITGMYGCTRVLLWESGAIGPELLKNVSNIKRSMNIGCSSGFLLNTLFCRHRGCSLDSD